MAGSRRVGTPVLRRLNTTLVLRAVRDAGSAQRISELTSATRLTRPTVAQAVDDLVAEGLLRSVGPAQTRGVGRPAVRVRLNGRAAPVVGVDLGVHSVAVAVADLAGERLALVRQVVPGASAAGTSAMLAALDLALSRALAEAGVLASAVAGVTAGSPGIVDETRGRIALTDATGGWSTIDLLDRLAELFRCPIRLENNANLVASAVYAASPEPPLALLAVQWGERLGAGIVIDGRLHRGAQASAGEIGNVAVPGADGAVLEATIGTGGIVRRAHAAASADPTSVLHGRLDPSIRPADAATVFEAASGGDHVAAAVVDDVARDFARSLAPVVLALNPDAIVIGGGIARAGDLLTHAIRTHLEPLCLHCPRVELSTLAQDAVVTGAVQVAHDDLWKRLLSAEGSVELSPARAADDPS